MPTLDELQARLTTLNTRIASAEEAQRYTAMDGLQIQRGDLASMYAERSKLEKQIDQMSTASSSGPRVSYGRMRRFR